MTAILLALWILFRLVLVPARTGRATTRPGKSVAGAACGRSVTFLTVSALTQLGLKQPRTEAQQPVTYNTYLPSY